MSFSVCQVGAVTLFVSGVTSLGYRWWLARWVLTENNASEVHVQRPESFHVVRVRNDTSPAVIVAKHVEAIAEMMRGSEAPVSMWLFIGGVAIVIAAMRRRAS